MVGIYLSPSQEDLKYVKYEFEKEGFICFEDPFDRDRPARAKYYLNSLGYNSRRKLISRIVLRL